MRTRKARGKNPAVVTLNHDDILDACQKHVRDQGFVIEGNVQIKLIYPKNNKGGKVEVLMDYNEEKSNV